MTRAEFQISARRMRATGTAISLGVILPIICLFISLATDSAQPLNLLNDVLSQHLPEFVDPALFGFIIGILVPFTGLFVLLLYLADSRLGLRCPNCHRSLTLRCPPESVLASEECSICHAKVFEEIPVA